MMNKYYFEDGGIRFLSNVALTSIFRGVTSQCTVIFSHSIQNFKPYINFI